MSFFEFPHTRTYDSDLGWIIKHLHHLSEELHNYIVLNSIKYADPIEWNITRQYEANTVVIDPTTETAYLSTQPVPLGVSIENRDYWTPIFNLSRIRFYETAEEMLSDSDIVPYSFAITGGFHSLNDGGNGIYEISTSAKDYSLTTEPGYYATLVYTEAVNVKQLGAYGDEVHDDTDIIAKCLNWFDHVHFTPGVYAYNGGVQVDVCRIMSGENATIKTTENNAESYKFHFKAREDVEIYGLTFDSNNIGRGSILLDYACKNTDIHDCMFTGYSAINGHYQTDSQLYDNGNFHTIIHDCRFMENGFQYGTDLNTLNRCIGVSKGVAGAENYEFGATRIYSCQFVRFNQGIVSDSENIAISDCYFEQNKDNSLYLFGKSFIDNCQFVNGFDEFAVFGSNSDYIVTNCEFRNAANKAIASSGNLNSLIVDGCLFETESSYQYTGQSIVPRSASSTWKYVEINDCIFDIKNKKTDSEIVIPNIEHCEINNNVIRWNCTQSGTAALDFRGTYNQGDFIGVKGNHFENYSTITTQFGFNPAAKSAKHAFVHNLYGNKSVNNDDAWILPLSTPTNTTSNWELRKTGNSISLCGTLTASADIARYTIMVPDLRYFLGNDGVTGDLIFFDRTGTYEMHYVHNNGYLMNWTAIPNGTAIAFDYAAFI